MNEAVHFPSSMLSTLRLALGGVRYWAGGHTPDSGYQSMISLFCQSGGVSNDRLARMVSRLHPPYELDPANGVLGDFRTHDLARITHELDERGYHVFERRLPAELCDRLMDFALRNHCTMRAMSGQDRSESRVVERYPREQPRSVRYDFSAQDVIDNADVQGLMADRSLIAVAQSYLRSKPIFDVMSMWWHTAYSKQPDSDAAQFYHFDMDRIKWLKFFIYLTDVASGNGPHCFIAGSHRSGGIPRHLLAKGYTRLTDEEVAASFAPERFIEFTGLRGTVIAEDTRGLHKGKHVVSGDRLLLQLQLSNSLYGGEYEKAHFSRVASAELDAMLRRYPRLYSNYMG
jgi:hypothetical protein